MKRFLAMVLTVVMVLSLCSFQVFAADATENKDHLKLQDIDWSKGTTNVNGTIFSFSSTHNLTNATKSFNTLSENDPVSCTKAMKIETGTEIKFTAPGKGTLYLYFCKFASGNTIKINDQAKPLTAEKFEYSTKANESVTVSKGSGNPQLGYIEWVSAGPDISFADAADEGVQFNIHVGATEPISVPFTVSGFKDDPALQVFAFSNNKNITATVARAEASGIATTAANSVNGDYVLTIKPDSGISAGTKATIYVGVDKEAPTSEETAEEMQCVQTISLTVTEESERKEALEAGTLYMPALGLSDISNLHLNDELIFVLKDPSDGKTKAIGWDGSNWLVGIDVKKDDKGKYVVVDKDKENTVALNVSDDTFSINSGYAKGRLIRKSSSDQYFSPSNLKGGTNDTPFGTSNKDMRIYTGLDGVFYLRGNSDGKQFLGYNNGFKGVFDTAEEAEQYRIPVEIYIKAPSNSIPVYYHDYQTAGEIAATQYVKEGTKFRPPVPNDVRIGDETYTLFGWTTDNTYIDGTNNLLGDDDYVNLYQFDKTSGTYGLFGLKSETVTKLKSHFRTLIEYDEDSKNKNQKGEETTPRANDFVEQDTTDKTKIDLYPVYVLSGKNKEVTVSNASGTASITVDNVSTNATAPRWRGSLTVQIFIDGKPSGDAQTMYFFYNSDNTVDIKLELTDEDGNAINAETSPFIINAVVAEQSGTSSNGVNGGIERKSNVLTATGGKLDNVIGGSTVKIYMSTRYRAEFYLNKEKINKQSTQIKAISDNYYSTTENRTDFDRNFAGKEAFIVAKTADFESGEYGSDVENISPEVFKSNDKFYGAKGAGDVATLEHGGRYLFGYIVQTYDDHFTVPSPKEALSAGQELLHGETWKLKNGAAETYTDQNSGVTFSVSSNTALADDGVFRFYAYTAGSLTITKNVVGLSTSRDYTFTVTGPDSFKEEVTIEDVTGTGSTTLTGLAPGEYTVTEENADVPGYDLYVSNKRVTATVEADETAEVTFTNTYTRKTSDLLIRKEVTGVTDNTTEFKFTLTLTAPSGVTLNSDAEYSYSGSKSGTVKSGGTFKLKGGEYITITGIPQGVTYTVTETPDASFTSTATGDTGTIGEGTSNAVFTNALKTGSLMITKTVTGVDGLQVKRQFTFTLTPTDVAYENGTPTVTNATRNADGSYTVTLDYDSTQPVNAVTVSGLPVGTYSVTEALDADSLYTASVDEPSVTVADGKTVTVIVTNTMKTGSLKVSKTVDVTSGIPAESVPAGTSFHFTVTFDKFPEGVSQFDVMVGTGSQSVTSGGGNKVEFDLQADGNITLSGIPAGVAYEVTESFEDVLTGLHYEQAWTGQKGSISSGTTANVTCKNTYHLLQKDTGGLRIIKEVDGEPSTKEFTFTITFTKDGKPLTELADHTKLSADGVLTVTLKAGETEFIPNIPVGTNYRVEETFGSTADEPSDVTVVLSDNEPGDQDHHENRYVEGTIGRQYNIDTLTYTNHYRGNLTISKTVEGGNVGDEFTFTVTLPAGTYSYVGDKTGTVSNGGQITLKGGESVTIKGLPVGGKWSVTETGDPNYTADSVTLSGTITKGATATAAFKNTRKTGSLTVRKVVTGKLGLEETDRSFNFTVTLTGAGEGFTGTCGGVSFTNGVGTFQLKKGESKTLTGLPANAGYTVRETDANSDGYVTTVPDNAVGTVTEGGATVTFVNDKPDTGTLTIENVVVNAPAGDEDRAFTFTITLYLDAAMTQQATDVNGEHGGLTFENGVATFTLKNGERITARGEVTAAQGSLYYRIVETPAPNYKASSVTNDTNGQAGGATVTGAFTQASANTTVTFTNTYEAPRQPSGPTGPGPYTPPPTLNTEDHFAYIMGYGDNEVRPGGDITRAEIVTILFRLLTDETRAKYMAAENVFPDVKDTDWFALAANTMANMGIVYGDESGFRPNDPITRAEMAAIVSRFFEYSGDTAFDGRYSDVKEDDWFAGFVHMVSRVGIMLGDSEDTFSPLDHLTRAQAMAVMNRLLGRKIDRRGFLEGMIAWVDNDDKSAWYYADVQEATNSHTCQEVTEDGVTYERWTELTDNRDWTEFEHGIGE